MELVMNQWQVVWVMEEGEYSSRGVVGIYSSAEKGMSVRPRKDWHVDAAGNWHSASGRSGKERLVISPWNVDGRCAAIWPKRPTIQAQSQTAEEQDAIVNARMRTLFIGSREPQ